MMALPISRRHLEPKSAMPIGAPKTRISVLLAAFAVVVISSGCRLSSDATQFPETSFSTAEPTTPATLLLVASATSAPTFTPLPATPTPLPTPISTSITTSTRQTNGAVTVISIANTTRYTLAGRSATELDIYMRTFGPTDSTGNRWFALSEPLFNWDYSCSCTDGGCSTGPTTIFVTVNYTLPTWQPAPDIDPILAGQWRFFEQATFTHERGHGEQASICGQLLGQAFVSVPPQDSCAAVDNAVSAASQPIFAQCRALQGEYEAQSNHGQTDGVVWPP